MIILYWNAKKMQWFQIKEQSAGEKRLILSWYLYKIFGKKILYLIAFFVSFFTFIFAKNIRFYSKQYFSVSYEYIGIKPTLMNQFKHIYQYARSLVDKILVCCEDFKEEDIFFENKEEKKQLIEDIKKQKGVFFICNHIGNIEILQAFAYKYLRNYEFYINMFVSSKQSSVFNSFLKNIKKEIPVKLFLVENIGISTGVELKENLEKGDIVFIAGDRLAQDNDIKNIKEKMFNREILLPIGTYKLAKLMDVPTYFISAINCKGKYKIILERQNDLSQKVLTESFVKFMEKAIKINPYQFFNFYDFFNSEKV